MSLTGPGGWGEPPDPTAAKALLRRAVTLGVRLFDTADSYGPEVERTRRKDSTRRALERRGGSDRGSTEDPPGCLGAERVQRRRASARGRGRRLCERDGIAYLPWRPVAKGSLARSHGALGKVAAKHGVRPAQVALAWLIARSPVIVPIPGTRSEVHLEENVAALRLELSPADLAELSEYRLSQLDARQLARRFVPPRFRRIAVAGLRTVRRGSG
jgi:aryl-alcohol dehydrogenase-like predicted oxidoreductase